MDLRHKGFELKVRGRGMALQGLTIKRNLKNYRHDVFFGGEGTLLLLIIEKHTPKL